MKLLKSIEIAPQFILMDQKTMTGLDVEQLLMIYQLNKGYEVTHSFLKLKWQQSI